MPEFLNDAQSGTASNDDPTDYFVKINGVDVAEFHPDEVILNEPLTVNIPAIVGGETLATFQVTDADSILQILNGTSSATSFLPWIKATHPTSTNNGLLVTANVADSGTNPVFVIDARKYGATTISVRPVLRIRNYTTGILEILANGNIGVGNTAPTEKIDVTGNIKATEFKGGGAELTNVSAQYSHFSIQNSFTTANRFCPVANGNTVSTNVLVANRMLVSPFISKNSFAVTKIGLEVTVAVALANMYIGIYELDANYLPTGAPVIVSTVLSAAVSGYKEYTLGATYTLLANKWYGVAVISDQAITVRGVPTFNYLGLNATSTSYGGYYATIVAGYITLPTSPTMTALNAVQNAPAIQLKL